MQSKKRTHVRNALTTARKGQKEEDSDEQVADGRKHKADGQISGLNERNEQLNERKQTNVVLRMLLIAQDREDGIVDEKRKSESSRECGEIPIEH